MEEKSENSQQSNDAFLEEKAYKSRTVLIFGQIDDKQARDVVRQLIALSAESKEPINILVCSPGGHVESGDVIHDVIRFIDAPVNMIGSGWVGSAAATIFLAAPKERRVCLPNTRFLIHQPSGGIGGVVSDVEIQAEQLRQIKVRIAALIAKECGKSTEQVLKDIERDCWMTSDEALDYGLISRKIVNVRELS
ncbi:ATP-dependent Clp protease proteolytic subunit [Massilia sp. W12]|uniref:ATP-dependent Clp protease proteolytic subunit n=1 Tax=Massilia sp. W12 TaxID=3126507 RepID=UPI0030D4C815